MHFYSYVYFENYYTMLRDSSGGITSLAPNFVFDDSFSSITIGSSLNGFTGFIWRITISNNIDFSVIPLICTSSMLPNCQVNCSFETYYSNNSCLPCLSTCSEGCIRSSDCNLCLDPICSECEFFNTSCKKCLLNANKNGTCTCDQGFYWNSSVGKCQKCQNLCSMCDRSDNC